MSIEDSFSLHSFWFLHVDFLIIPSIPPSPFTTVLIPNRNMQSSTHSTRRNEVVPFRLQIISHTHITRTNFLLGFLTSPSCTHNRGENSSICHFSFLKPLKKPLALITPSTSISILFSEILTEIKFVRNYLERIWFAFTHEYCLNY